MTSVALTGTNHAEDQMVHLRVATLSQYKAERYGERAQAPADSVQYRQHVQNNMEKYAGLLGHACPAGVYEYVDTEVLVPPFPSPVLIIFSIGKKRPSLEREDPGYQLAGRSSCLSEDKS